VRKKKGIGGFRGVYPAKEFGTESKRKRHVWRVKHRLFSPEMNDFSLGWGGAGQGQNLSSASPKNKRCRKAPELREGGGERGGGGIPKTVEQKKKSEEVK